MFGSIKKWLIALLAVVVLLVGVITIRTVAFTSKQVPVSSKVSYPIDVNQAAERLGKALQFQTVSDVPEGTSVDYDQFTRLHDYLSESFPLVHSTLDRTIVNEHGLLYVWKGSDPQKKPILLTGHYDVMPASAADEGWKYPPFSGTVADGYVWGRGARDDKDTVLGIMEATEYLIRSGFRPTRSIYMAFGYDEEHFGHLGAENLAAYLKSQGLQFEAIIDEGGTITQGVIAGIPDSQWIALVGTGEKGFVTLELTAETEGGHTALPPKWTSVGILAAAIDKIESNPFPARWTTPMLDAFEYLGPEMKFPNKVAIANMWLFGSLVQRQLGSSSEGDAVIRTTQAPTVFQGARLPKELPTRALADVNIRTVSGDTVQSVVERVKAVVNDPRVTIVPMAGGWDAPPDSIASTASFQILSRTLREAMPDVLVAPLEGTGATDGRYYVLAGLSPNLYRITPQRMPSDEIPTIHGIGERISIDTYGELINFYIQLERNYQ